MTTMYHETLTQIRNLDATDQLRLLEELAVMVRQQLANRPRHSILELRGLGKEIWKDVDAQAYVNQERASWDG